ncbi:MAG TPA: wax ester/triacylglycerol synthase family O-acyltransferase [Solirubrobacteraceae bacterium]|nr:wax ester/triacylglycerol synthase family O-acyltransferase [Solirubrobacteraceae bacterium]
MVQQHLDRLTSTDAGFLHQESPSAHMHIGGVLLFEGPAPKYEDVLDHIRGRLHLVPRYRQKLATPPVGSGRPLWVDDTNFNIEYHVRHAALPAPGSESQLLEMAARVASQPLDRTKPLWEFWLVEGIEPAPGSSCERFAMISKNHHALVDGISGIDLATVLLDFSPKPKPADTDGLDPWEPQPEPTSVELVLAGALSAANAAAEIASRAVSAATQPGRSVETLRDAAEGVGEIVWAALNPAPATPLNVAIGPHRRFRVVRQQLGDYKTVKDSFGGTVNDVVLAVVAGALGGWLRSRGIRTDGVEMRALVPVSVRTEGQQHTLGNRLSVIRGPLPVYIHDPAARLAVVSRAMDDLKSSKQAVGAATLVAVNDIAPPAVLAQASRLQFSTRLFNLLVTNIPGPQVPLYILGHKLEDLFPLAFLPDGHALAVAIMSYDGRIEYGLLGDFDALPDIDVIADGIDLALAELIAAAGAQNGKGSHSRRSNGRLYAAAAPQTATSLVSPSPLLPTSRRRPASGPAADMRAKRTQTSGGNRSRSNGKRKQQET